MGNTTPREIFTALIDCISSIPLLDDDEQQQPPAAAGHSVSKKEQEEDKKKKTKRAANPLRRVPISHRHLLITLHVLLPGMVLPALDLLDRGLVTRLALDPALSWKADTKPEEEEEEGERNKIERGHGNLPTPALAEGSDTNPNTNRNKSRQQHQQLSDLLYIVYSSAQPSSRPRKQTTTSNSTSSTEIGGQAQASQAQTLSKQKYLVRLRAWNCTCAAFAFASVQEALDGNPADIITGQGFDHGKGGTEKELNEDENDDDDDDDDSWSFGGLTLPEEGNLIPTCKHLLACLLAERWSAALGEYVVDRRVGREEMAGIVADI